MERATQRELIRRILGHVTDRTTDTGEAEARYAVEDYYDQRLFESEIAAIFRRHPLIAAHTSQIERPGDFVTQTMSGIPVLVVRAPSGDVRAFLNVCRHRGAEVVTAPCGAGLTSLVCPYHAWTYDLDGRLRHVPDRRCFPDVDDERSGLVAVPTEVRHGFVWVTLTPEAGADGNGGVPCESYLGALDAELASYGFEHHVFYRQQSFSRRFNWKSGIESFLENYHFAVLHRNSTDRIFLHNTAAVDRFDRHVRFVAPKRTIRQLADVDEREWDLRRHATILYAVFPNACFFIEKNLLSLLQVFPEAASESRIVITYLVQDDRLELRSHWERNIELFMAAVQEDFLMCESMHRGLRSGANAEITFGRAEVGSHLFRQSIHEALAGATAVWQGER
jgi:phenylpropionate dioxygenase-like ring-hydroxylating dioxygenase large terminal subunit